MYYNQQMSQNDFIDSFILHNGIQEAYLQHPSSLFLLLMNISYWCLDEKVLKCKQNDSQTNQSRSIHIFTTSMTERFLVHVHHWNKNGHLLIPARHFVLISLPFSSSLTFRQ